MRLRRVDCSAPGIRRVRRGRGFSYVDEDANPIEDARRRSGSAHWPSLRPGPTCGSADPRGHIQATGYDDAGRRQYLYHDAWRKHRDREKFRRWRSSRRRWQGSASGSRTTWPSADSCASACSAARSALLDLGFFRIGSERYAAENETYGLATLKKRQLRIERGSAVFDYRAKGSKRHVQVWRTGRCSDAQVPQSPARRRHRAVRLPQRPGLARRALRRHQRASEGAR